MRRARWTVAVCCWALLAGGCAPAPRATPAAATTPTAATPPTVAELVAAARRSVVVVGTPRGLGTGFVVAKGVVATNLHVVAGSDRILVALEGRKPMPVSAVLGFDVAHDLALLSVPGIGDAIPALSLGMDGALNPGDAVVAIGTPQGLEFTVSTGIVSAIRKVSDYITLLQITAPISPGSSGGPLFDARGRVIGVTTMISTSGQNLNFAVPSGYLASLLEHRTAPLPLADFGKLRWARPQARPPASPSAATRNVRFPESVAGFALGASLENAREACPGKTKVRPNWLACSSAPVPLPFTTGEVVLFFSNNRLVGVQLVATSLDDAQSALSRKYGPPAEIDPKRRQLSWSVSGGHITVIASPGGRVDIRYVAPVWNEEANY